MPLVAWRIRIEYQLKRHLSIGWQCSPVITLFTSNRKPTIHIIVGEYFINFKRYWSYLHRYRSMLWQDLVVSITYGKEKHNMLQINTSWRRHQNGNISALLTLWDRSPVDFPHKGQYLGALLFSLIYAVEQIMEMLVIWDAMAHYEVTLMFFEDMCGSVTDMECNHSVSSLSSLARQMHRCCPEVLSTNKATTNVLFYLENYVMRYIVTNRLVYYTILYAIPFLVNISIGMCSETWFDKGPADEVTPIS